MTEKQLHKLDKTQLIERLAELEARLIEAEDSLRAIREGEVDAIVVSGPAGEQVFSLHGSESIYRLMIETMNEAGLAVTPEGTILFANNRIASLLDYELGDVLGRSLISFLHLEDHATAVRILADAARGPVTGRLRFISRHGRQVPVQVWANFLNQPEAATVCLVGTDLTQLEASTEMVLQLRQQHQALAESEQRYRALVESSPDAVMVFCGERLVYANSAAMSMFAAETVAHLGQLAMHRSLACITNPQPHHRHSHDQDLRRLDGSVITVAASAAPIVYQGQQAVQVLLRDISDRKRAQQSLFEANEQLTELAATLDRKVAERTAVAMHRTEQLRRLAEELSLTEQRERRRLARVLHDHLQQLLVAAKFRTSMLSRSDDPTVRRSADNLLTVLDDSIAACRSLTSELSPPILSEAGLMPAIHWLRRWMAEKHELRVDVRPDQLDVELPESAKVLLFEAVRELLFNVIKHSGVRKAEVVLSVHDDMLSVRVSDAGRGFDTSQVGWGDKTGFGLFSMKERLSLLGARLEIDSRPGGGSRFEILIPMTPAMAAPDESDAIASADAIALAADAELRRQGIIRILVADDHKVVREGISLLLSGHPGLEVIAEAADGQEAVELARKHRPDVVLMDIGMPRLGGIDATRIICRELPEVRVIGLSMHDAEEQGSAMRDAGAVDYIVKSDATERVVSAIRQCVCRSPEKRPQCSQNI